MLKKVFFFGFFLAGSSLAVGSFEAISPTDEDQGFTVFNDELESSLDQGSLWSFSDDYVSPNINPLHPRFALKLVDEMFFKNILNHVILNKIPPNYSNWTGTNLSQYLETGRRKTDFFTVNPTYQETISQEDIDNWMQAFLRLEYADPHDMVVEEHMGRTHYELVMDMIYNAALKLYDKFKFKVEIPYNERFNIIFNSALSETMQPDAVVFKASSLQPEYMEKIRAVQASLNKNLEAYVEYVKKDLAKLPYPFMAFIARGYLLCFLNDNDFKKFNTKKIVFINGQYIARDYARPLNLIFYKKHLMSQLKKIRV